MAFIQPRSAVPAYSTHVGNNQFSGFLRAAEAAKSDAAVAAWRTAVGEKADICPPARTVDVQVFHTLAMSNDGFVLLALPVGVVVGENNPASAPVAGARTPRTWAARTTDYTSITIYGFAASHHQVIMQTGERRLHMLSKGELLKRGNTGKQQNAGHAERDHQFEDGEARLETLTCAMTMNMHKP